MKITKTAKLSNPHIAVILTSALYVNKLGATVTVVDPFRLNRLKQSVDALRPFHFGKLIVLDATLPNNFSAEINLEEKVEFVKPNSTLAKHPNEYQIYGPSRLEIDLMANAQIALDKLIHPYSYVVKLSAGYTVTNLQQILQVANGGVVYRFGNPFRSRIRFCLSSFYILPPAQLLAFAQYAATQIKMVSKTYPLEAVLYDFMQTISKKAIQIDYPFINAIFLSSQTSSNSRSFQLKQWVYQLLSKLGFYAYAVAADGKFSDAGV